MDSSCACLMRLAGAVHQQGLQGRPHRRGGRRGPGRLRLVQDPEDPRASSAAGSALLHHPAHPQPGRSASMRRRPGAPAPAATRIQGVRTAQQDLYDLMAQARSFVYSGDMWKPLDGHSAYDDLDITNDRFTRVGPAQPVALRRLQGDAGRPLAPGQGRPGGDELVGRGALPAPRRRRDRVLRLDRAGVQAARLHRQVAAPPGRRADAPAADRQPPQDDVPRQPVRGVPRPGPPAWVDQLLSRESLEATGYFDPEGVAPRARRPGPVSRGSRPSGSSWT